MSLVHNFSLGDLPWFFGVVEDRDDDLGLGRVRVRAFGFHPEDKNLVPTEHLPWAIVVQDVTSSAQKGIGSAPVGMQVGTHVLGIFADGANAQVPVILGTLAGMPDGEPDTSNLARGEDLNETIISEKTANILLSNPVANIGGALSAVQAIQGKINDAKDLASGQVGDLRGMLDGIGIPGLNSQLGGITGILDQVQNGIIDARIAKAQVEGMVNGIKNQIEYYKNLDPETLARNIVAPVTAPIEAGANNLQGAIDNLKNFDINNITGVITSIAGAIDAIGRMSNALRSLGQIQGLIAQAKGLSLSLPNFGAILGLSRAAAALNVWTEPATPAAPQYPMNQIMETEGGHIEEFDNTPGAERYQRYHPSGSFIEVHPDGTQVEKIIKDNYTITMGDKFVHVEGNVQVNIIGNSNIVVNGDATMTVTGNRSDIVNGDYALAVGGDYSVAVGGQHLQGSGVRFQATAPRIDLN